MRSLVLICVGVLSSGCPGDVVEGSGSGASDGDTSSGDGSATMTMTGSDTMTVGSQSQSDSMSASDSSESDPTMTDPTMTDPTMTDPTMTDPSLGDTGTDTTESATMGDTTTQGSNEGTTTGDETTGEPACEEPDENAGDDNNSEGGATALADIACSSSANVDGVGDGDTGPDWFSFHGAYDELACGGGSLDYAEPRVQVVAGGALNVCVYATCPEVTATCTIGMASASPDGRLGCCGAGDAHAQVNCDGGDEDADIWVSVDTAGLDCVPYTLTLSF